MLANTSIVKTTIYVEFAPSDLEVNAALMLIEEPKKSVGMEPLMNGVGRRFRTTQFTDGLEAMVISSSASST